MRLGALSLPRGRRNRLALGAVATFFLAVGVTATGLELPGPPVKQWLGLASEPSADPPCRLGLYERTPRRPPQSPGDWRPEAPAPEATVESSAVAIGDDVWVTNGSGPHHLRTVMRYDARRKRWTQPTRTPTGLNHAQPVAYKDHLLLPGGFLEGRGPTPALWQYEPGNRQWTRLPPMEVPRGGSGNAVIGDKLYVAGGGPNDFPSEYVRGDRTLEIFDLRTRQWSRGPDMPTPRHHTAAAALDGKLYVAGGRDGTELSLNAFERYDPRTGRWEKLPPLPMGVSAQGTVAAKGRIVIVGGANESNWRRGGGWVTPSAWAFDPRTRHWRRLPDLDVERRGFGIAYTDGRVYAVGGSFCSGLKRTGPVGTKKVESLRVR